jgi:hypothetical protein
MPFPAQKARTFNRTTVEALQSGQTGCYGLLVISAWIYVGTGDIRTRLLGHLNGDNPCIMRTRPTHWVDLLTSDAETEAERLIAELKPTCNTSRVDRP